jgi:hypothetical protein
MWSQLPELSHTICELGAIAEDSGSPLKSATWIPDCLAF